MKSALNTDKLSTLSTVLLSNLDETVFFSKISGYIHEEFGEYKVRVFSALEDGETELMAENGEIIENGIKYPKGEGISGYVARLKRAYYSNSKRDPLLATTQRDECVVKELCVPINVDGTVIATIHVQSDCEERMFGEEDVTKVLEILSGLGAAINNMKMYLIARNLNKQLQEKIALKELELEQRGPVLKAKHAIEDIEIIGHSNQISDILTMANKIAKEDFPVMIQGESGTGRKLLAKKIHSMSLRAGSECITVHCEAIESTRLEAELFGRSNFPGLIEKANGGTLILDNVQALPLNIQAKLLRTILSGEIFNIDSNTPSKVNVRIVSIANESINKAVEDGEFREDLLYRLNIINMSMPSLKERQGDIKVLAEYFLNRGKTEADYKMITSNAAQKLLNYNWPGNLQELRNLMERTYILTDGKYIEVDHLPELASTEIEEVVEVREFSECTLAHMEKEHIIATLDHLNGNKTRAAKSLGITVKTLYNKLHSYGLVAPKSV